MDVMHCELCFYCEIDKTKTSNGICRRNPPNIGFEFEQLGDCKVSITKTTWPSVNIKKDWYGKFKTTKLLDRHLVERHKRSA